MKLDKYTFARLVAFIGNTYGVTVHEDIMKDIDDIIDVQLEQAPAFTPVPANPRNVAQLLTLMAEGTNIIEAINLYRYLTGDSLKKSKDVIERHWNKTEFKTNMIASIDYQINYLLGNSSVDNHFTLNGFSINDLEKVKEFIRSFH